MSVYKVIDIIGTSTTSWEDAAVTAVKTAGPRSATFESPRWCNRIWTSVRVARSSTGSSCRSRSSTRNDKGQSCEFAQGLSAPVADSLEAGDPAATDPLQHESHSRSHDHRELACDQEATHL